MSIEYCYYNSVNDYEEKKCGHGRNHRTIFANKMTLIRGAISYGFTSISTRDVPREVLSWRVQSVLGFIKVESNRPLEINNIEYLEQSEKVNVAFFMGMTFAQIHMQKVYHVRHLFHLNSQDLHVVSNDSLKRPDLWGISNSSNISYLVEAKGSTKSKKKTEISVIKKAEAQLEAIDKVRYKLDGQYKIYENKDLKKLIVATHPDSSNKIVQDIVDPTDKEKDIIEIDGDEAIYKYYIDIIKFISKNARNTVISKMEFTIIEPDCLSYSIGVVTDIYTLFNENIELQSKPNKDIRLENLHKKVNEILDNLSKYFEGEMESNDFSVGIDGIIVIKNAFLGT